MTAHVFIVDEKTFALHLRHQFAGIGAGDHARISFNDSPLSDIHASTERNLVGMIADMSRLRRGDRVFFYVQSGGGEGRFYGRFRIREDAPFLDNGGDNQFLLRELGKSLTFRAFIEPDEVYPEGVSEWRALDEIRNIARPYQMLWSLIYRKLKGNRGCTMITHYEEDYLHGLIRDGQRPLSAARRALNFDPHTRRIVAGKSAPPKYAGETTPINIHPRMLAKENLGQQIEIYLQAHITRHIGRADDPLTQILTNGESPFWIGNEVKCGVGMQSIDVMLCRKGRQQRLTLIELKSVKADSFHIRQIRRYVEWTEQYYLPNSPAIVEPVLIARRSSGGLLRDFLDAAAEFNRDIRGRTCEPLRLVEFSFDGGQLCYQERDL